MKAITFIAIATMSMWIAGSANAQQNNLQDQEQVPQVEGEKGAKGKRGNRRRQGQKNMQNGQGQEGQGQRGQGRGQRGGGQMLDGLFKRFDKDQNGSISVAEAPDRMKQRFEMLDTNGDKSVSKEELQAVFEKMGQGRRGGKGEAGKGQGRKGGKGEAGKGQGRKGAKGEAADGKGQGKDKGNGKGGAGKRGQGQSMDPAQLISRMDKNNDGVISLDEAPEKMKQRFSRMDADSSGTITAEEMKQAFEMMKNKGGKGGKNGQIGRDKSANADATKPVKPKRPPTNDGA